MGRLLVHTLPYFLYIFMSTPIDTAIDSRTGWHRARIVGFSEDGVCGVALTPEGEPIPCDLLESSDVPLQSLAEGDEVMVWVPASPGPERHGVVMGRIRKAGPGNVPGELYLRASKSLTLQCEDGSITLRSDGKILIKGKELVSRAEGTNWVKGAAVSIN